MNTGITRVVTACTTSFSSLSTGLSLDDLRERERERERQTDRQTDRDRHRVRDRHKQTERETETERDTETEGYHKKSIADGQVCKLQ